MPKSKKTKPKKKTSKTPKSMDELLVMYSGSLSVFQKGDEITGKVIEKRKDALVLDIGGKSEGLVAGAAFEESRGYIKNLEPGDEVSGRVIVSETPEGYTVLSLRQAAKDAIWKRLQSAKSGKKQVNVLGKSANSSGVLVEIEGLVGFIPNSHVSRKMAANVNSLIGKNFKAKIIELDRDANKVVLSERAVSEAEEIEMVDEAMKKVKKGDLFEGKVVTVVDFGVFVEIKIPLKSKKIPVEGLVHVSEMAWVKVASPKDVASEGDKVKVKIVGVEKGKLALSMKQAEKDPWDSVEKNYKVESKAKGEVVKLSDFGAFVQVEPGVEGLIHITKIPPNKRLKVGDKVNVYVEDVNKKERRLSLGLVLTAKPVGYK